MQKITQRHETNILAAVGSVYSKYSEAPMTAIEIAKHSAVRSTGATEKEIARALSHSKQFRRVRTTWGLAYYRKLENPLKADNVVVHTNQFGDKQHNVDKISQFAWLGQKTETEGVSRKVPIVPVARSAIGTHIIVMKQPLEDWQNRGFTLAYLPGPELAKLVALSNGMMDEGGPNWHHFPGGLTYVEAVRKGKKLNITVQSGFKEQGLVAFAKNARERGIAGFEPWTSSKIHRSLGSHIDSAEHTLRALFSIARELGIENVTFSSSHWVPGDFTSGGRNYAPTLRKIAQELKLNCIEREDGIKLIQEIHLQ